MSTALVDRVLEVLSYDPNTGSFKWAKRLSNRIKVGDFAGSPDLHGYTLIGIDGALYKAHRLAFAFMEGRIPTMAVDHINGNPSDNSWANLREVDERTNQENRRKPYRNSRTGFLGVVPKRGRFGAYLQVSGKSIYLGTFDTPEEAHMEYVHRKRELHAGCTL